MLTKSQFKDKRGLLGSHNWELRELEYNTNQDCCLNYVQDTAKIPSLPI